MPYIGAVADDLTGATTTGVLLARSKARTAVFFNEEAAERSEQIGELDAIIVSSNRRPLPPDEAYAKVASATKALMNMGVEIDAMLDVIGQDSIAVVVPAMPQSGRILVGGFSVIDGTALSKTPVAQDVRTPVYETFIPKLLAGQSRRKVDFVTLDTVLKGTEQIQAALQEKCLDGAEIIVVDGITLEDVQMIAQAVIHLEWNTVAVDPGAFTSKLAYCRGLIEEECENIPEKSADGTGKTVLIAAGSATPVTKKQMKVLCEDPRHLFKGEVLCRLM